MKDRIGNKLALGDRVLVDLPSANITGFIGELKECGLVALRRGTAAGASPGHILVSVVFSLPVDCDADAVPQVIKVYDPDKSLRPSLVPVSTSEPPKLN